VALTPDALKRLRSWQPSQRMGHKRKITAWKTGGLDLSRSGSLRGRTTPPQFAIV
jgi:hypothetical protein